MFESSQFHDVVRKRHSVRSFLSDPIPREVIHSVLNDAQLSPSNCNTQPWQVHILSGAKRDAISKLILAKDYAQQYSMDFEFSTQDFKGIYQQRARKQGETYYKAIGISRQENEKRRTASRLNLSFFGAPHVALLFMRSTGDNVRVAGDIGMYAQTFLLSLTAHGLGGIPQTYLSFFADPIREQLGIDASSKLLFGISFGYPNEAHAANQYRAGKVNIEECVTFHE